MEAGVRLIEVEHLVNKRVFSRYAVTSLRNVEQQEFTSLAAARAAFDAEVAASRADPIVGRYVN